MHWGSWPCYSLQLPADQQVELLVGAAELDVGLQRDRVVALHQRIQELVHGDRLVRGEALREIVPLQHPRDRVRRGQADHPGGAQRLAPLGVVADLGPRGIEHLRRLRVIRLGIGADLLARERRPRRVAPRGVADHRREVADQEDHVVAEVLHPAHLVEHDGVADVDVGRGRIESQLDPQRLAARELGGELGLDQELVGPVLEDRDLLGDGHGHVRPPSLRAGPAPARPRPRPPARWRDPGRGRRAARVRAPPAAVGTRARQEMP